jgi:hypothetical protein
MKTAIIIALGILVFWLVRRPSPQPVAVAPPTDYRIDATINPGSIGVQIERNGIAGTVGAGLAVGF